MSLQTVLPLCKLKPRFRLQLAWPSSRNTGIVVTVSLCPPGYHTPSILTPLLPSAEEIHLLNT